MDKQTSPTPPKTQPEKEAAKPAEAAPKQKSFDPLRSKRAWGLLAVILFLLACGTIIPVGKIPLLRQLAYAMGYSEEDALKLSLFQALFTWSEHRKELKDEELPPDAIDVFGAAQAADLAARRARGVKADDSSTLFDIKTVNAFLMNQGRQPEDILDASGNPVDGERRTSSVHIQNPQAQAIVRAQEEASKKGDIYFGQEVSLVQRDPRDGFDTVNLLKKVSFPLSGVSSAGSADWFLNQVDKASRQDAQLGNLQDGLQAQGLSSGLGNIEKVGKNKSSRDLYWAWMTGRAARRTPQVILKKTLASSGFNGAELPKSVFVATGGTGIAINKDEMIMDMTHVKDYLELDEKCRAAVDDFENDAYRQDMDTMRNTIKGLSDAFPKNCGDRANASSFNRGLQSVQNTCRTLRSKYNTLHTSCSNVVISSREDHCYPRFENLTSDFAAYCNSEEEKARKSCEGAEDFDACFAAEKAKVDAKTLQDSGIYVDPSGDLQTAINNGYFQDGNSDGAWNNSYFPSADWGSSLWVDSQVLD